MYCKEQICSATGNWWARARVWCLCPPTAARGCSDELHGIPVRTVGAAHGHSGAHHPTTAKIWPHHRHLWGYTICGIALQWTRAAKCPESLSKKHLEHVLLQKQAFRSGEFYFSTQGHAESNVPGYSWFYTLNYGQITNGPPLHWI